MHVQGTCLGNKGCRGTETAMQFSLVENMGADINNVSGKGGEVQMTKRFQKLFRRFHKRSGQSLVEYALILALISVVAILVLKGIGTGVNTKLSNVNGNLQ